MTNKSVAKLGEMAEEGVEGLIAAGFQMHGYRQGTKECVAFYRGFTFALKIAKEAAKDVSGVALPRGGEHV